MEDLEIDELRHCLEFAGISGLTKEVALASYRDNRPTSKERKLKRLHDKMGHAEPPSMKAALQSLQRAGKETPFKLKPADVDSWVDTWCPICAMCKSTRKRYQKKAKRPPSTHSNALWVFDVNGPEKWKDRDGCRYHLCLEDDFDGMLRVFNLRGKDEDDIMEVMLQHEHWVLIDARRLPGWKHKDPDGRVKCYLSDAAYEYCTEQHRE